MTEKLINNENVSKLDLTRTVLVGVVTRDTDEDEVGISMDELERLLDTAGGIPFARVIQNRDTPDNATYIGSGKVVELRELCMANDISLCVFDCELSPSQIKNLEDELSGDIRVIDRTMLILDIFALTPSRAGQASGWSCLSLNIRLRGSSDTAWLSRQQAVIFG